MKVLNILTESNDYVMQDGLHSTGEQFSDGKKTCRMDVFKNGRKVGFIENTYAGDDEYWMFFHEASATEGINFGSMAAAKTAMIDIDKDYFVQI